jgi:hypothetical protein
LIAGVAQIVEVAVMVAGDVEIAGAVDEAVVALEVEEDAGF